MKDSERRAMFRKLRTPFDRDYNNLYHASNSDIYAQEQDERNEGFLDRNEMPKGTYLIPRTHFSGGRFVHHMMGETNFQHEDKSSRAPIKREKK